MSSDKEAQLQHLKTHLGITPKTGSLLYASGYTTPQSLANSSPNEFMAKFAALPGMSTKNAKVYCRGLRRMVMLGAIEDADEAAKVVSDCKNWSNVELSRKGVYEEGFDDFTGVEILKKMRAVGDPKASPPTQKLPSLNEKAKSARKVGRPARTTPAVKPKKRVKYIKPPRSQEATAKASGRPRKAGPLTGNWEQPHDLAVIDPVLIGRPRQSSSATD